MRSKMWRSGARLTCLYQLSLSWRGGSRAVQCSPCCIFHQEKRRCWSWSYCYLAGHKDESNLASSPPRRQTAHCPPVRPSLRANNGEEKAEITKEKKKPRRIVVSLRQAMILMMSFPPSCCRQSADGEDHPALINTSSGLIVVRPTLNAFCRDSKCIGDFF
jgi:hypothetical protein